MTRVTWAYTSLDPHSVVSDCALPLCDWNLLFHGYRLAAGSSLIAQTDTAGVTALTTAGFMNARFAHLYGIPTHPTEPSPPHAGRDIDILFIGNMNPAVQVERMPWIARLANLADRRRVVIATGVFGDEYHALLRRAKVVFNRSIRGECNQRVGEAVAAGAVLFQEASNKEIERCLTPGVDFVSYTGADLERLLEQYLNDDDLRERMAASAWAKVGRLTAESLMAEAEAAIAGELDALRERVARLPPWPDADRLRAEVRNLLERGAASSCAKTAGTCREILVVESSLWTYARVAGVEPTNNAAERAVMPCAGGRRGTGRAARPGVGSSSGC